MIDDARLAEIRKTNNKPVRAIAGDDYYLAACVLADDVELLLTEVDRLRGELARRDGGRRLDWKQNLAE